MMWQTILEVGPLPVFFDDDGHVGFPIKDAEVRAMIEAKDPRLFAVLQTALDIREELALCMWFSDDFYADYRWELCKRNKETEAELEADLHVVINSPLADKMALCIANSMLSELQQKRKLQTTREIKAGLRRKRRSQFQGKRAQLMLAVIAREGVAECKRCGSQDDLTLDHIVPLSKGGSDDPKNLQLLCQSCNSSKGDRDA